MTRAATLRNLAFAALGLLVALPLGALETTSPELRRSQRTSTLDEVSLKPLFLFDMRGRRDPFVPYPLLAVSPAFSLDINGLNFSGTLKMGRREVALFTDGTGKPYLLRGDTLFDAQNEPVANVRGEIAERGDGVEVVLTQGERKLTFSNRRLSKRLAQGSQP